MIRLLVYIVVILFFLCVELMFFSGCAKEYSYEGGPAQDTLNDTLPADTIPKNEIKFPFCYACKNIDESVIGTWSFKYDTSSLCGNVTAALIAPEGFGFTFFGPSACSIDTGLVMTVYVSPGALDANASNVTSNKVIFEYYDNVTLTDIFMTDTLGNFSLTVDTYDHATGIAKGRFGGYVPAKNGDVIKVNNGKFAVKFQ